MQYSCNACLEGLPGDSLAATDETKVEMFEDNTAHQHKDLMPTVSTVVEG